MTAPCVQSEVSSIDRKERAIVDAVREGVLVVVQLEQSLMKRVVEDTLGADLVALQVATTFILVTTPCAELRSWKFQMVLQTFSAGALMTAEL
jgi:hypothetical protein